LRTEDGLKKASAYFENAINLDPNFALAYAYLADTYALMVYYGMNQAAKDETLKKAEEMARKALELDPNCSEAMTALATLNSGNRVEESFDLLKRAIEVKPNNVAARQRISWMYAHSGNLEKALEEMRTAQNLDPQARATNIGLAQLLNVARRPDESVPFSRRVLELNPKDETAKLRLADSFEQLGNFAEAEKSVREILQEQENNMDAVAALSRILAKKNEKTKSLELLKKIAESKQTESFNYEMALVYIVFGENERAVGLLKKSAESGGFIKLFLKNDYNLDPLRQNAEFVKLLN
jgi:tetratricopeptide (TPR) repeat protein